MIANEGGLLNTRRSAAVACAQEACAALSRLGVTALVFGSLATPGFGLASDIDLLVIECPRDLKYGIEGLVEDHLRGFAFDVVYLDEVPAYKLARFTWEAVGAGQLG